MPMPLCTFKLNGQPMSTFTIRAKSYPAFSGMGKDANKKVSACIKGVGPIPPGTYYIVDRPTGGVLGSIRDWLGNKGEWFALFADDGSIDDSTLCDQVFRGNFRLHPKGPLGRSEGCITIDKLKEDLNKWIPFMVRQAHHERNQHVTVRPEPVEGLNQSFLKDFNAIRDELKASPQEAIPNSQLKAYAKVVVE